MKIPMQVHQLFQISTMAALLLKKKYLDCDQIKLISNQKFLFILSSVQNCMSVDKSYLFLKRCCQILVKIHIFLEQKKDLINIIEILDQNNSGNIKMTLMYLIEIICEYAFDDNMLVQHSGFLSSIFEKGLRDEMNEVRIASFKTLTIFLSSINDEKVVKKFNNVLSILMQKSIQLIKYDQQSGVTALESLNQLIQAHPKFIKPILNDMLTIFTQIMETQQLLPKLRITAMHGVLLLCMNHETSIRKSEYFKTKMVLVYMKMLSEDDGTQLSQWAQELNDEIISKNSIPLSTQEHIQQILNELGNKFMLPLFIPYIQQALSSDNPSYQHSGLAIMGILTENCHQSFKKELKNIIGLILPLLNTENPVLTKDILVAMGYMCQQFCPQIQQQYGDMILQFICKGLQHFYPKIQFKAVQCIQNFEKGLSEHKEVKVIEPYLNTILSELGKIFEVSLNKLNYTMLEAVLDSIATIASMNPFSNYYLSFMPGLKKIISMIGNDNPQKVMIRAKTIQTMGYLLSAVKDNQQLFKPDCQEIMQSLISLQSTLDRDDTIHRAMFIVYENVVECLKENFIVYSDFVFQAALQAVNMKVDFKIIDETEIQKTVKNPNMNKFVKMKIDLKLDGVKNIVLNTDSLQQKLQASNLLSSLSEYMGKNFQNYIIPLMSTVQELMVFKNSKQIRNNMIQIFKYMVLDCSTQQQQHLVLNTIFPTLCQQLSTVIKTRDNVQTCNIVEVMSELISFMPQEMAIKLPEMMNSVIALVKSLVKEVEKIYSEKEMDEDLNEQMGDQIAEIEEAYQHIETIMVFGKGNSSFDHLKKLFPSEYQFNDIQTEK